MKLTKIALGLTAAAAILIVGCTNKQTVSEESLGLRNTDLYSEYTTVGDETKYRKTAAGASQYINRAFENAPPMIPHDVEGMLPITIKNNACLGCHEPAVAASLNATAIPASHFTNYRPNTSLASDGKIVKEGKKVVNTADFVVGSKKLNRVSGARFNCSQCHAPQSENENVPTNEFQADFRDKGADRASNLVKNMNEGVQTIK
jgi:cytochrome c-type protein NapB